MSHTLRFRNTHEITEEGENMIQDITADILPNNSTFVHDYDISPMGSVPKMVEPLQPNSHIDTSLLSQYTWEGRAQRGRYDSDEDNAYDESKSDLFNPMMYSRA